MTPRLRLLGLALLGLALGSQTLACADVDDEELTGEDSAAAKGKKKNKDKNKDKGGNGGNGGNNTPEVPAGHRFSVVQHNVGGGAENGGAGSDISYTFAQIEEKKPDAVMLEEVCAAQLDAFKARFPGWAVRFTIQRERHEGCGNQAKGNLVASPRGFVDELDANLGEPDGDKVFSLTCGGVPMPNTARSVLACVTHLRINDPNDSLRDRQVWRMVDAVRGHVNNGREVVIAGDFNLTPERAPLDRLYRLKTNGNGGGGAFDEADQTDPNREKYAMGGVKCGADACRSGVDTAGGRKIDYAFFSNNRVVALGAQTMGKGGSSHNLYHAWADLKL